MASLVPVKIGVVVFVMSSLFEVPVSDPDDMSREVGAAGAVVSTVTVIGEVGPLHVL